MTERRHGGAHDQGDRTAPERVQHADDEIDDGRGAAGNPARDVLVHRERPDRGEPGEEKSQTHERPLPHADRPFPVRRRARSTTPARVSPITAAFGHDARCQRPAYENSVALNGHRYRIGSPPGPTRSSTRWRWKASAASVAVVHRAFDTRTVTATMASPLARLCPTMRCVAT